ncbi:unnamed protein product [Malus baccata var. baccata]
MRTEEGLRRTRARDLKPVNCSTSCREIQNIKYPFRLKGDPSGCGDPDDEFACVNGKTILEIFPRKYYVHNISYDDQILVWCTSTSPTEASAFRQRK